MEISNEHNEATSKVLQIFKFLQSLDQLRNPVQRDINRQPWFLWLNTLPDHPTIERGSITEVENNGPDEEEVDEVSAMKQGWDSQNFILKVKRPKLSEPPQPPEELRSWLQGDWKNISSEIAVSDRVVYYDEDDKPQAEYFDSDPRRAEILQHWLNQRQKWKEKEVPARQAMEIFERLYALQAMLEREGEKFELMVGDGLLSWLRPDGNIKHPLHLQKVNLSFDPDKPQFIIYETEQSPPELYTAIFRSMPDVNAGAVGSCREELEQNNWHPLGGANTESFYNRLAVKIAPQGEYVESFSVNIEYPQIKRDPVIFLRKRNLGFGIAIESIINNLSEDSSLPSSLKNVVGIETTDALGLENQGEGISFFEEEDENVLLTKAANLEQIEIARRLARRDAVLVQGPPGTGKTHTIGNLIGHLQAQGKSILITSHTSKALSMVRHNVVEQLQPLCVSVLNDKSNQLKDSGELITEKLASFSGEELEKEAEQYKIERKNIIQNLREAREALYLARQDEYRPIVLAGQEFYPSEAARYVAAGREEHAWIPLPVVPGEPLPLTVSELMELYNSNKQVTGEEESELEYELPNPSNMMTPSKFEGIVLALEQLSGEDLEINNELWVRISEGKPEELQHLLERLKESMQVLISGKRWQLAAVNAGREGGPKLKLWNELIEEIEEVNKIAHESYAQLFKYNPAIDFEALKEKPVERILTEIFEYLKSGGKINYFKLAIKPSWKVVVKNLRVNDDLPSLPEDFDALLVYYELEKKRKELISQWEKLISLHEGIEVYELGSKPEAVCKQIVPQIKKHLKWHNTVWSKLEKELKAQGFNWEKFLEEIPPDTSEHGDLIRLREAVYNNLPTVLAIEEKRRKFKQYQQDLSDLYKYIEQTAGAPSDEGLVKMLKKAVEEHDANFYLKNYDYLVELHKRAGILKQRNYLLSRLDKAAPAWALAVRNREGVHGYAELPGDPEEAWKWRQLNDELDRRASISIEEILKKIEQLNSDLRRVTSCVVEKMAWAHQVKNTSLPQRQALMGWNKIMQKMGKRTGKRVPRLIAEARKLMPKCQTAVPVWIMPLNRVVENFDPVKNAFDVVIIDEASQADLMALIAVYMSRQVIVVGDHEQVSPDAVGMKVDETQHLIDEHLKGIPNNQLYDGQFSIYDLAQTSYEPVCLREHFRCVQPIIQFSNYLSYGGKIKPLRNAGGVKIKPHTVAYRIENARKESKSNVNKKEALIIASLLAASLEQPEYEGATFGAISLVGNEQARYIEWLLHRYLPPSELFNRKIQCGNSAQFQGDERDIIFLSMVDVPIGGGPLSIRHEDSHNKRFKRRFNVAASRARDQVWVVHSLDPYQDLQEGDIRRKLILHAKDPEATKQKMQQAEKKTESEFERLVIRRLIQAGYCVTPQWLVGSLRIDMVVESSGKKVAIECDGERFHTQDNIYEDMARQAVLERLGWRFLRIRGSSFFRNPDKTMEDVFKCLNDLDIQPMGHEEGKAKDNRPEELIQRISARAAELRREWTGEEEDMSLTEVFDDNTTSKNDEEQKELKATKIGKQINLFEKTKEQQVNLFNYEDKSAKILEGDEKMQDGDDNMVREDEDDFDN